jgi:hypothetical protein
MNSSFAMLTLKPLAIIPIFVCTVFIVFSSFCQVEHGQRHCAHRLFVRRRPNHNCGRIKLLSHPTFRIILLLISRIIILFIIRIIRIIRIRFRTVLRAVCDRVVARRVSQRRFVRTRRGH